VLDTWHRSKRGEFASPSIKGTLPSVFHLPYLELVLCYLIFHSLSLSIPSIFIFLLLGFWSKYFSKIPFLDAIIKEALEDFGKSYKYFGSYKHMR
jgi:hypothetical protein